MFKAFSRDSYPLLRPCLNAFKGLLSIVKAFLRDSYPCLRPFLRDSYP